MNAELKEKLINWAQVSLLALATIVMGAVGYTFGESQLDPEVVTETQTKVVTETLIQEVIKEVATEKEWKQTLILGLTEDGTLEEVGDNQREKYIYILTINMGDTDSDAMANLEMYLHVDGDTWMVVNLRIPSGDYEVLTDKVRAADPDLIPEEGEDGF